MAPSSSEIRSNSGKLSTRGGNGIGSLVKATLPSSRRVRRTGILIFTRGVIFLGGAIISTGGPGFSGAEESVGDSSSGGITISPGGTITESGVGTNTEKLPVDPPDHPPEGTGTGCGVSDVTETVSRQLTIIVSKPEVTVIEAVLVQAEE